MKKCKAVTDLGELFCVAVSRLPSSIRLTGAYKHQPIDVWVYLGVLDDIPIWHPRSHDANRKQYLRLRNVKYGEHVRMGVTFTLLNHTKEPLGWVTSICLGWDIKAAYSFHFLQAGRFLSPDCLNAYRLPTIIPLPNVREPGGRVFKGFVAQFYDGEYS